MNSKTTTFFGILFIGALFSGPEVSLAKHYPKSCSDGYKHLGANRYKSAISTLTKCLRSKHITSESRGIAHYNRAVSYFLQSFKEKNIKKIDKFLMLASDDVDKAIKYDKNYAKAYCLRGQIWLNFTLGDIGYDDLDKGRAMGAPKNYARNDYLQFVPDHKPMTL